MLTASSMYNHYYGPWNARLQARNRGQTRGGWIAKYRNRKQWLQVDLGVVTRVKRIATQGRYDANQWVKSYTLSYSNNGIRFIPFRRGRRVQVIGSFSMEDGDDSENVTFIMNSRFFKLCRVYSSFLKRSNVGDFPWNWILTERTKFRSIEKEKILLACLCPAYNVKFGFFAS